MRYPMVALMAPVVLAITTSVPAEAQDTGGKRRTRGSLTHL